MPNQLEMGIIRYVTDKIDDAPNTLIETGLVTASTTAGYSVKLNGVVYTNVPTLVTVLENDTVKIVIPNGQYNNMFILGKLKLV